MSYASNSIYPIFLFFASVANLYFLLQAGRDWYRNATEPTNTRLLFALSIAELIWVLPCWIQCLANLIVDGGNHWYVASNWENNTTGCDIMGFYSIFASVSGQLLVTLIAYATHSVVVCNKVLDASRVLMGITVAYFIALLMSLFPVMGVGSYAFSGEGFCYIDWSDKGQVVLMELVTWPCLGAVLYWYGKCATTSPSEDSGSSQDDSPRSSDDSCIRGKFLPPPYVWWGFAAVYASAWLLWIPAGFIGTLSSGNYPDMFPTGYMIAGGTLGHLQALINPLFYGIWWRKWFHFETPAVLNDAQKGGVSYSSTASDSKSFSSPIPGHQTKADPSAGNNV